MKTPAISIIMPCYNGEAFIAEAIESIFKQSLKDFELIVVDDGSTDSSCAMLEGYKDKIVLISQINQGVSAARNRGIKEAKGDYIAFLDCDDYWAPDFLQKMLNAMDDPKTAIAYCGWQNIGCVDGKPFVPPDYEKNQKLHHLLRFASPWPIHAILIRRKFLPEPSPFNQNYPSCEDYDLWLRIAAFNRIQLIPTVLAFYRQHNEGQATSDQAMAAHYNLLVKERFLKENPSIRQQFSAAQLREYCAGAYLQRGYHCLWNGDLKASHRIFRRALIKGLSGLKDLKYALPAMLPSSWYTGLIKARNRTSEK